MKKNLVLNAWATIVSDSCHMLAAALVLWHALFFKILIDFLDPLVIAEKIAFTENYKYITIDDIAQELRDGKKGVSGIGANGKMTHK